MEINWALHWQVEEFGSINAPAHDYQYHKKIEQSIF